MTRLQQVTSVHGIRYRLGRELGHGGQGAVFAVEGERLAVKLLRGRSPQLRERLRDQLAMVARLPLEGLAVARPVDQLRPPHVGYVMELFTGMVPLLSLMKPPKGTGGVTQWYLDGGGLGRRLRLLAYVAEAVAALHGSGLVYADLSPHNVFVSKNTDDHEVRLIDIDNLHPATTTGHLMYTPRYGAPEVVRQTGSPSTLADAHAFAVLAFETLALAHPLLGDAVRDGEPELEEKALRGELPWIEAPDDDGNRSSDGIPRELVVSPVLQQDFQRAFGPGLSNPDDRPGLTTWAEHLHGAGDRTIVCPSCLGSYYVLRSACPWCEACRPDCMVARVILWDPRRCERARGGGVRKKAGIVATADGKARVVDHMVVSQGTRIQLTERTTHGASGNKPALALEFENGRVTATPLGEVSLRLVTSDGKREKRLDGPTALPAARHLPYRIHCGESNDLHRVIRLDLHEGAA